MEWQILRPKKAKLRRRGGVAVHELARKQMVVETAKSRGRKRENLRLETLERAEGDWQKKKGKRRDEEGKTISSIKFVAIDNRYENKGKTRVENESQDLGIVGWLQQGLAWWAEKNPESKKKEKRPNSADMAVILRKAVAKEKALTLGRKLPDLHVIVLKHKATRWQESKEKLKKR
jgi:hypothetical protein